MTDDLKSVAPSGPETDDEELRHRRWALAATAIGYNHIALNDAKTLGHKVYFRMARDHMLQELVAIGGESPIRAPEEKAILTLEIKDAMPHILFHERDIDLMRKAVIAYDAAHDAGGGSAMSAGPVPQLAAGGGGDPLKGLHAVIERHDGWHEEDCGAFGAGDDADLPDDPSDADPQCDCGATDVRNKGRAILAAPPFGARVLSAANACIEAWAKYGLFKPLDEHLEHDPDSNLGRAHACTKALREAVLSGDRPTCYAEEPPHPCTECPSAGLPAHNRTDDVTKSCHRYIAHRDGLYPGETSVNERRILPYAITLNGETVHLASAGAVEALQRMVLKAAPTTVEHLRKLVGAQKDWVCPACAWPQDPETLLDGDDDRPLPEDAAIKAAFPTRSERHDLYGEAMRMVGAKYSKGALVALVNWLLHPNEKVKDLLDTLDQAIKQKVPHTGTQSLANIAKALRKTLERR